MDLSTHTSLYYKRPVHFDNILNDAMTARYFARPSPAGRIQPAPSFAHLPRSRSFDSLAPGSVLARSHSAMFPLPTVTYLPSYYYMPSDIDWYPKVVTCEPVQIWTAIWRTACLHHQRFADRYPFLKHRTAPFGTTQYAYSPIMSILDSSTNLRGHYAQRDRTAQGYLDNALSMYQSQLRTGPHYGAGVRRTRGGGRTMAAAGDETEGYSDVENAVKHFNKRYYSVPSLMGISDNRNWFTPKYWQGERNKIHNVGSALIQGDFEHGYASRY